MPELPEVETVKETLKKYVLSKKIVNVEVYYERILENINKETFTQILINQTIQDIQRYGKYLIFVLTNGFLISHLRMEGKYHYNIEKRDKHTHLCFYFQDGTNLAYHDVRKFGRMVYFDANVDIFKQKPLNQLGKEPFDVENGKYLYEKIHHLSKSIKQILLDQSILAGIGNIYADEICFASKISPFKEGKKITRKQCDIIIENAKKVLKDAIKLGGSTVKSFQSAHGIDGLFQTKLNVYGKQGTPCPICNHVILKDKIAQRGTHYCPHCQRK